MAGDFLKSKSWKLLCAHIDVLVLGDLHELLSFKQFHKKRVRVKMGNQIVSHLTP